MEIVVYNPSGLPTCDFEEFTELQEDFKIEVPEKSEKLKNIILERGFKYPFVCWVDESGTKYIIDAHRRKAILDNLRNEGWKIPPVPYYEIQAESKKEAVEEILLFNSKYSDINPETALFKMYDIDVEELPIDIAEINVDMEDYSAKNREYFDEDFEDKATLKLEFDLKTYNTVVNQLSMIDETPEKAVLKLLRDA